MVHLMIATSLIFEICKKKKKWNKSLQYFMFMAVA